MYHFIKPTSNKLPFVQNPHHHDKIGMFVYDGLKKKVRQPASNLTLFTSPLRLVIYEHLQVNKPTKKGK